MRDSNSSINNKPKPFGILLMLVVFVGGIAGGILGWVEGQAEVLRLEAGIGRHVGPDHRGVLILGLSVMGWFVGMFATYFLLKYLRRSPDTREDQSGK